MLKKSMLVCCLLFAIVLSAHYTVKAAQPISVVFNEQLLVFDVPPTIINDRTMVPLRIIFEAHGADVRWDDSTDIITATKGDVIVVAKIGDNYINVNGSMIAMDVAPVIVDGRTLVPARFIAEALGSEVSWNSEVKTVFITNGFVEAPTNFIPDTVSNTAISPDQDDAMFGILHEHLTEMQDIIYGSEEMSDEKPEDFFTQIDELSDESFNQPDELHNQPAENIHAGTLSEFTYFIANFTQNMVVGLTNDEDRIRAVYDFMVLNFMYQDGVDGPAVDGSRRPHPTIVPAIMTWSRPSPSLPFFTIESGGFSSWPVQLENSFVPMDLRDQFRIFGAYRLLVTGEGVCNCFAQLFNLLLASLGYETRYVSGSYINRSGAILPHVWSAVRLDGAWYFFDTQVEASNLTRLTTNRTYIPYHWFRQPVSGDLVAERYVWDRLAYGDFR